MQMRPEFDSLRQDPVREEERSPNRKQARPRRFWLLALAVLAIVAAVVFLGIAPRVRAREELRAESARTSVPTVSVVHPTPTEPAREVVLPANVQAFASAPIYARTNGYLKRWYADIGTRVRKGQLLAEIETPEVDAQLRQARANLATAQANLSLSKTTAERYEGLLKTHSVAQQDADNAAGSYAANQAIVQSNRANVRQLEEVQSFQRIYAPFDGVITARNTDIGALINSGSSGGAGASLFTIAQPNRLRVYVNVLQALSPAAKPGLKADLILTEFPGRRFPGVLVRTANAIDQATRTLQVEIQVDNPTGQLLSGAYAEVHLKLPNATAGFILPANTLLFRAEGLRIAAVQNGQVELRPLTLGHDLGDRVEVLSGVQGNDLVVVNPPDSILSGQKVRVVETKTEHGANP